MAVDFQQAWEMAEEPTKGIRHRFTVSEIVAIGSCPFEIAIIRDGKGKLREVPEDNTKSGSPNALIDRWKIRKGMKLSIMIKEKNNVTKRRILVCN